MRSIPQGEYLNGLKHGKSKRYNKKGNLYFEGEYKKGERNGKGKEYDKKGRLIFEGEYLKGKRWDGILKNYFFLKVFFHPL